MKYLCALVCALLLAGCAPQAAAPAETAQTLPTDPATAPTEMVQPTQTQPVDPIRALLNEMSLEERVGQLFLARCDGETALQDIAQYHLGGFVLFAQDFENQTPDTLREKLASYQAAAKIPLLLAVDEEGGTVTRISRFASFRESPFPSPQEAFAQGGLEQVLALESEKGALLASLGLNVNLGPVCDVATEPGAFMYQRSLGQDAAATSAFAAGTVEQMAQYGVGSALKHFPGYGNNADTHTGIAVDSRPLAELEGCDLLPFQAGVDAGCGAILVSHTIVEAFDSEMPASLSPQVHQYLREKMGFDGVIITDDLAMQAITERYGAGEAAVLAVLAGNDLLCATDYATQYNAVWEALMEGRIDIDTLNAATGRVLQWKIDLGLL